MKAELRNKNKEGFFICDEIELRGFKYYINFDEITDYYLYKQGFLDGTVKTREEFDSAEWELDRLTHSDKAYIDRSVSGVNAQNGFRGVYKLIATTNPNIDAPKVIDEVEELANKEYPYPIEHNEFTHNEVLRAMKKLCFRKGYNKHAETHPNSDFDMCEFAEWNELSGWHFNGTTKNWWSDIYPALFPTTKELLQLWKSKQLQVIYFI